MRLLAFTAICHRLRPAAWTGETFPFLLSDAHFHRLRFLPYLRLIRDSRIHPAEAQNKWPRGALTLALFVGGTSPQRPMG
jgi:hypothetical protein